MKNYILKNSLNTLVLIVLILIFSCKKDTTTTSPTAGQTVKDIDGNVYHTVTIGTQTWMVENLKTTHYRNGNPILNVEGDTAWTVASTPAFCWYNYDSAYGNVYGALYNWYAVNTGILCPTGWHVPSQAEWTTLITYLGGEDIACDKLKEAGQSHWYYNTTATNESGFTALPGSCRTLFGGFNGVGNNAYWWSSTEFVTSNAWYVYLTNKINLFCSFDDNMRMCNSVRCIKD